MSRVQASDSRISNCLCHVELLNQPKVLQKLSAKVYYQLPYSYFFYLKTNNTFIRFNTIETFQHIVRKKFKGLVKSGNTKILLYMMYPSIYITKISRSHFLIFVPRKSLSDKLERSHCFDKSKLWSHRNTNFASKLTKL